MSDGADNLVSNRFRGKRAKVAGSRRRTDRSHPAEAGAVAPRRRRTRGHPRKHAEENREREGQSYAVGPVRDRRCARREDSRPRLQVTGQAGFATFGLALAIVAVLILTVISLFHGAYLGPTISVTVSSARPDADKPTALRPINLNASCNDLARAGAWFVSRTMITTPATVGVPTHIPTWLFNVQPASTNNCAIVSANLDASGSPVWLMSISPLGAECKNSIRVLRSTAVNSRGASFCCNSSRERSAIAARWRCVAASNSSFAARSLAVAAIPAASPILMSFAFSSLVRARPLSVSCRSFACKSASCVAVNLAWRSMTPRLVIRTAKAASSVSARAAVYQSFQVPIVRCRSLARAARFAISASMDDIGSPPLDVVVWAVAVFGSVGSIIIGARAVNSLIRRKPPRTKL